MTRIRRRPRFSRLLDDNHLRMVSAEAFFLILAGEQRTLDSSACQRKLNAPAMKGFELLNPCEAWIMHEASEARSLQSAYNERILDPANAG